MELKKTYSYFLKDNIKTTAIVYLVVAGVTLAIFLLTGLFGESLSLSDLIDLIPNFFTVAIVSFIISIVASRSSDLICNQFGKTRETSYISNILVMLSLAFVFALLFSFLKSFFYTFELSNYLKYKNFLIDVDFNNKEFLIGPNSKYISRLSFFIYNFSFYSYIAFAFSTLAIFIYSLWVRLERLYRWFVFLVIPLLLAYSIPKIIISYITNNQNTINIIDKLVVFFGLENGVSLQYFIVSTLVILLPLLIISYFIMQKKALYGKKK